MPVVVSSAIAAVDYDPDARTLFVSLRNERVYAYADVAWTTYEAFLAARSKGVFYNDRVRDTFACVRVR